LRSSCTGSIFSKKSHESIRRASSSSRQPTALSRRCRSRDRTAWLPITRYSQHRPTTPDRRTSTCILSASLFVYGSVDCQQIVNEKLFACADWPEHVDEDPPVVLDGLAVRHAGVVQPARAVTSAAAVYDPAIRQAKQEGVTRDSFTPVSAQRVPPRCDFTLVFERALARCERTCRKYTLAVNRRSPDGDASHCVAPMVVMAQV
jgi:hypothetical protein